MYKNILFDLDGTLTDPGEGIKNSVVYALNKYGINAEHSELDCFIGPPLFESFIKYYGFDEARALEAIEYYREYFRDRGIFENKVYSGIPELLKALKSRGIRIALATSKPEVFALRILEYFDLLQYFDAVCGATLDGSISKKGDIVKNAINELSADPNETVMVGDRMHDIIGAHENGLPCIALLFGYGNEEEFNAYGAEYIVSSPEDILMTVTK